MSYCDHFSGVFWHLAPLGAQRPGKRRNLLSTAFSGFLQPRGHLLLRLQGGCCELQGHAVLLHRHHDLGQKCWSARPDEVPGLGRLRNLRNSICALEFEIWEQGLQIQSLGSSMLVLGTFSGKKTTDLSGLAWSNDFNIRNLANRT